MRRFLAALSAVALVVAGLVASAGASSANGTSIALGGLPSAGDITITTGLGGGAGEVTYTDAGGTTAVQTVSNNSCDALTAGALVLSADGGACFRNLGFGVERGREGLPWWQGFLNPNTDADEVLELSLTLPDVLFLGEVSLDIEAVRTGDGDDVKLTAFRGDDAVQTIEFDLTDPVVSWPPNYRAEGEITAAANRLELTALGDTRFQLEGDTNNREGSRFALARITEVIDCDGGTAEAGGATLTLMGGDDCTDEPVVFERDGNEISLLKSPSDAEFMIEAPWTDSSADAAYPGRATQIDYFDERGFNDMVFCDLSGGTPALPIDQIPSTPEDDGWCIADRAVPTDNGDGTFTTVETLYGKGDPRMR